MLKTCTKALLTLCVALQINLAQAAQPVEWGLGLQKAASPSKARIVEFHDMMLWIIGGIVLLVFALLAYVVLRYNKKANPEPATFSHNVPLEIIWTAIPVIILIVISIPSMKLLYYTDRMAEPEMTLKVTGYQWYWGYEYPDHGDIAFSAYMIPDADINPSKGEVRLLSTDEKVVLPVDTNIQILVTSADVIHSFAVPALGLKTDAIPGRMNETWLRIEKPGVYYGQCSELCGKNHAYMPSEIHAVPKEEFEGWVIAQGGEMPAPEEEELAALDTQN